MVAKRILCDVEHSGIDCNTQTICSQDLSIHNRTKATLNTLTTFAICCTAGCNSITLEAGCSSIQGIWRRLSTSMHIAHRATMRFLRCDFGLTFKATAINCSCRTKLKLGFSRYSLGYSSSAIGFYWHRWAAVGALHFSKPWNYRYKIT